MRKYHCLTELITLLLLGLFVKGGLCQQEEDAYLVQCSEEVKNAYNSVPKQSGEDYADLDWCRTTMKRARTIIGKKWGSMNRNERDKWTRSGCEDLIQLGHPQTCREKWGWQFLETWLNNLNGKNNHNSRNANPDCYTSMKANTFCRLTNATLEFSKVKIHAGESRSFEKGFVKTYGKGTGAKVEVAPGYFHSTKESFQYVQSKCDVWERRPTFVLSNDDSFNLSHYINDVIMMWSMLLLSGRNGLESLMINFDGIRKGGPAGGVAHKIVKRGQPDAHGPFGLYVDSWFQEVNTAVSYGQKHVCFSEIYFQYFPGFPWFWNDWSRENECSHLGPSPLYQSFSLFLRNNWKRRYGVDSLPPPPLDKVHVVIEVRVSNKRKPQSRGRIISNLNEVVREIEDIPGVKLTVQEFSKIPFKKQVALAHSAGVFVSMHGAGTANMFSAGVGHPNCCALIELFPDGKLPFKTIRGFGNLARHYGMYYYRYDAKNGDTSPTTGTQVDAKKLADLVRQAVNSVQTRPSCINNATSSVRNVLSTPSIVDRFD